MKNLLVLLSFIFLYSTNVNATEDTTINNVVVKEVSFSKQSQQDASFGNFDAILGITEYVGIKLMEDNMALESEGVAAFYYYLYDGNFNLIQQRIFHIKGSDYVAYKEQGNAFAYQFIMNQAGLVVP